MLSGLMRLVRRHSARTRDMKFDSRLRPWSRGPLTSGCAGQRRAAAVRCAPVARIAADRMTGMFALREDRGYSC